MVGAKPCWHPHIEGLRPPDPCAQQRTPPVEWKSPPGQRLSGPVPEPDGVGREAWVESRGRERMARRRTNAIRPHDQVSWRVMRSQPGDAVGRPWAACTTVPMKAVKAARGKGSRKVDPMRTHAPNKTRGEVSRGAATLPEGDSSGPTGMSCHRPCSGPHRWRWGLAPGGVARIASASRFTHARICLQIRVNHDKARGVGPGDSPGRRGKAPE
jgi:hypothetical protein